MTVQVSVKKTATVTGTTITLEDLRKLVEACKEMKGTAAVTARSYAGDYNQGTSYTITVTE